jgi:hypothetical protein
LRRKTTGKKYEGKMSLEKYMIKGNGRRIIITLDPEEGKHWSNTCDE